MQQIVAPKLRKRTESESSQAGPQKSDSMPQQKTEMKQDLSDKKQQSQVRLRNFFSNFRGDDILSGYFCGTLIFSIFMGEVGT